MDRVEVVPGEAFGEIEEPASEALAVPRGAAADHVEDRDAAGRHLRSELKKRIEY